MSTARPHRSAEERLRAFLDTEAKDAMAITDTDAELRRFHDRISTRRSTRRPWMAAAAAAAFVGVAAAVALLDTAGSDAKPDVTTVAAGGTLAEPVPLPAELLEEDVDVRSSLADGAFPAAGSLWHVARDGTLERIDPATGEVELVVPRVQAFPPVVEADGLVWFAGGSGADQRFYALDPATSQIVRETPVVPSARWIGAGPAGLWAVTGPRQLTELDPATGAVLRTIDTQNGLYDVVVGRAYVYSGAQLNSNGITVVDVRSGRSRLLAPEVAPGAMALTRDDDLWVHDVARAALVRLDGATLAEERSIALPLPTSRGAGRSTYWSNAGTRVDARDGLGEEGQAFLAIAGSSLYASLNPGATPLLMRADADTGEVTHVFQLGEGGARGPVTAFDGSLWLDWRPGPERLRRVAAFG